MRWLCSLQAIEIKMDYVLNTFVFRFSHDNYITGSGLYKGFKGKKYVKKKSSKKLKKEFVFTFSAVIFALPKGQKGLNKMRK